MVETEFYKLVQNYIPVKEYAQKHKISVQAVYKRIKTGRMSMRKIGTYTLVTEKYET